MLKCVSTLLLSLLCAFSTGQTVTFLPQGSVWKYLDDGSDQGTAWQVTGFDDSGWASGPAQLGYGDGDEATVVDFGGDSINKYITTYFRTTFQVDSAAAVLTLDMEILRDDGAVVYLNGTEVIRTNMPAGTISFSTLASSGIGGAGESQFYLYSVSPALLVTGSNSLAVEVHQVLPTSSDISFDMIVEGTLAGSPPAGTLVEQGATWKYLDNGSDQGTAWRATVFNDSAWASGPAQLGYGDGDEATVVDYGGVNNNKYTTTYFRHAFNVPSAGAVPGLTLRLLRDDGAVVYLNGTEVLRSNMPGGTIHYLTFASGAISGGSENVFTDYVMSSSLLQNGTNVLAVEIHQSSLTSSDISFDLELLESIPPPPATVTRGPYLQNGSGSAVTVCWRTSTAVSARVWYGDSPGNLNLMADDSTLLTDHKVRITGLSPETVYYYAIGTLDGQVAGGDSSHYVKTSPVAGTRKKTKVWVIGDSGTGDANARSVRNAYQNFANGDHTDVWLMLGDNAYTSGTDNEFQTAVFQNMYEELLVNTVLWPTPGNHDYGSADGPTESGPYYDIFAPPRNAEAGGIASGTEAYYSFDYGNIHFISLDSHDTPRGTSDPMMSWLQNDLAATTQEWIIAFWHHPPYTKGSHDSDNTGDSGGRMRDMREDFLPVLEAAGVDLVLSGHSHSYERSYFVNGHYDVSSTFNPATMLVDPGSGKEDVDCAYQKTTSGPNAGEGAVYVVAGSSGKISGGALNHPVMYASLNQLGSVFLEVEKNRLDLKFINSSGTVTDYFSMMKDQQTLKLDTVILQGDTLTLTAGWVGNYVWNPVPDVSQSIVVSPAASTLYTVMDGFGCLSDSFQVNVISAKCGKDGYEPNNRQADARNLYSGVIGGKGDMRICPRGDEDWFYFQHNQPGKHVAFHLKNLPADFDLEVYDGVGLLAGSHNSGTQDESLLLSNLPGGMYYLRIYGINDAWSQLNPYSLTVNTLQKAPGGAGSKPSITAPIFREPTMGSAPQIYFDSMSRVVTVSFVEPPSGELYWETVDLQGRIVRSGLLAQESEKRDFQMSMPGIAAGAYILRLHGSAGIWTEKLLFY